MSDLKARPAGKIKIPGPFGRMSELIDALDPSREEKSCPQLPNLHALTDLFLPAHSPWEHQQMVRRLYQLSNHTHLNYYPVLIPKRSGGFRRLDVPMERIKFYQDKILEEILSRMPVHPCAKAYVKGSTLRDAALPHVGKPLVVKLDIHDFYGSVTFGMVYRRVFGEDRYPKKVGMILANLCCCRGVLPQGAPTSPAISNLVMVPLDEAIFAWCQPRGIAYTRYSDDLTFSGDFDPGELIREVRGILSRDGFRLNREKTQIIRQGQRQIVTGVVVNEKAQLPASYRRSIRQEVHYCRKFGVREHILRSDQTDYIRPNDYSRDGKRVLQRRYLLHLLGQISYALQIDPDNTEMLEYRNSVKAMLASLPAKHRRFAAADEEMPF